MAFTNTNDFITGRAPVPTPAGGEVLSVRFALAMAVGDLALNSIGQIGILPAGCVPAGLPIIDATDMDSGAGAGVYQLGVLDAAGTAMSAAAADGGGDWGNTGTAVATAFCKQITPTLNNIANVAASASDRKLGVKVTTAPSTAVAGTLGVTLFYRAA